MAKSKSRPIANNCPNKSSPGGEFLVLPTAVGFKDHDVTKTREPMYSMAPSLPRTQVSVGPGPAHYSAETKSPVKSAYMAGRTRDVGNKSVGPGPAWYKIPPLIGKDRTRVWMDRSPDYVFGQRLDKNMRPQQVPGPVGLPEMMGKDKKNVYPNNQPQYSMAQRFPVKNYQVSPGPAKYDPWIKDDRAILITMKGRHPNKALSGTPGPLSLQDYKPGKSPPSYSMGRRLCAASPPMIVPGDNC